MNRVANTRRHNILPLENAINIYKQNTTWNEILLCNVVIFTTPLTNCSVTDVLLIKTAIRRNFRLQTIYSKPSGQNVSRTLNRTWQQCLTHWGRVTHICVSKLTIIGPDNGLSPGWRQAIIWTNAGILLIRPLGTNFNEILIEIYTSSLTIMHLKMSSRKWRPFCLGLNVLINY